MDSQEMREFYDLCQAYRHAPIHDLVGVAGAYENLLNWVRGAKEMGRKAGLEEAAALAEEHPTGMGANPLPLLIRRLAVEVGDPLFEAYGVAGSLAARAFVKRGSDETDR